MMMNDLIWMPNGFNEQCFSLYESQINEPPHEKTNNLHRLKKVADQLRSKCEADQRLCFRYWESTDPLLLKSEISCF